MQIMSCGTCCIQSNNAKRKLEEEARRNDHESVAVLDELHVQPGRMLSGAALDNIKVWAAWEDRADEDNQVRQDVLEQIPD